jgi:hypothetical protein
MTRKQLDDSKEKMAIGAISNFFGCRYGRYNIDRIFKTIGLTDLPQGNKSEKISCILMHYFKKDNALFVGCLETLIQYHQLTSEDIDELRKHTLRLGYDIRDGHVVSSYGKEMVVSQGRPYDAFKIIEKILLSAKNKLHIIDPYVDESLFELYLCEVSPQVDIKILTKKMSGKFKAVAEKFKNQRLNFEVRISSDIHDRYILVDDRAWMFGQSIKDAGNKTLGIVEYENPNPIEEAFTVLWSKSKKFL